MKLVQTWDDIANSERWRGLVAFIRNWIGPFDASLGITQLELDSILSESGIRLPAVAREWICLARHWQQGGLNVWIPPEEIENFDSQVTILSDTEGVTAWYLKTDDIDVDDPPVFSINCDETQAVAPSLSKFIGAMIINDLLFANDATGDASKLDPAATAATLTTFVSAVIGNFYIDSPLESAAIVAYGYPDSGEAYGKSRTAAGAELLQRLRV